MTRLVRRAFLLALSLVTASQAHAQFPGDVFFETPFVTVPEGEAVELDIVFFSGTDTHGAVAFEAVFNETLVQIEETTAPVSTAADRVFALDKPNRVSIVSVNDDSLDQPFGVAAVARIRVRPLVPAGQSVTIALDGVQAVDAAGNVFPVVNGFSASITVVSPLASPFVLGSASRSIGQPLTVPHPLTGELRPVARLGALIERWSSFQTASGLWGRRHDLVQTRDPASPSD